MAVFVAGFFVQAIGSATSFLEADVAGGYYDAQYNYRMSFSPIAMHIHLLLHYAASRSRAPRPGFRQVVGISLQGRNFHGRAVDSRVAPAPRRGGFRVVAAARVLQASSVLVV